MDLYPLDPLGVNRARQSGEAAPWMHYLRTRQPRTIAEILRDGSARMDEQDRRAGIGVITLTMPRRSLRDRLRALFRR